MDPGYVVGIDLGGTKILTARCDLRGGCWPRRASRRCAGEGPERC